MDLEDLIKKNNIMNILFRVDSSVVIGSGHLMRCLTLAERLRFNGYAVAFVCMDFPGAMFELLDLKQFMVEKLPKTDNLLQEIDAVMTIKAAQKLFPYGVNGVVVDHYGLDATWEKSIRAITDNVIVIDDLANRIHDCDLLLDQNYYLDLESRYTNLVPHHCISLLGPSFVLLRDEFIDKKNILRERDGSIKRILVFFGGTDPSNQTHKVLDALNLMQLKEIQIDVVVGISNPHLELIKLLCDQSSNLNFHCQITNMAELISKADLGIGAGGAAMLERCFLGLPSITVVFAKNQECATVDLSKTGAIKYIGWADRLDVEDYIEPIGRFFSNPEYVKQMSNFALSIISPNKISFEQEIDRLCFKAEIIKSKNSNIKRKSL